ncbi:MAG: arabinogalactan endo-1,4-beta-galactosidase [Saprospiraceae bacterium]|nr:arabinogalactan endo-1,4-beta-galactosidase [Saprospiraceae bacterium]
MLLSFVILLWSLLICTVAGCQSTSLADMEQEMKFVSEKVLYLGADLSYVNEMEDCGGTYRLESAVVDPFEIFATKGANMVRVRLWHNPTWTSYSNLQDATKTIRRAKEQGMEVLLDFHYSDDWADPGKQIIPAAWREVEDTGVLGDSLYQYTFDVLMSLNEEGLMPEIVQVGNEINSEILVQDPVGQESDPLDWNKQVALLNKGLQAVADASSRTGVPIGSMLHIAQPENAFWWMKQAVANGISPFDWIGLSYYPKWSDYTLSEVDLAIDSLITLFDRRVMIVETAYPYSLDSWDDANNILDQGSLLTEYPATPAGQKAFMIDLTSQVVKGGGEGVIYWEPAWISTSCRTRWGRGSHWENATFFDAGNENEVLPVFEFLLADY